MKVYFDSIGCRLNQSEIEKYASQFRSAGHIVVSTAAEADMVVINTCTVTAQAASDSRQKTRQARKLMREDGEIVLTGCWATLEPLSAQNLARGVRVVSNPLKDRLAEEILGDEAFDLEPLARVPIPGIHRRTRAFLKVQDGCDNRCTFCITRIARGAGRSRAYVEILSDVRSAVEGESKEIILTGVHLGSWGQDFDPPQHVYDLVKRLLSEEGYVRMRLSSLEPWDLDERFFSLWDDPRLCRHIHLPLQSGCEATLRRMARKTTPAAFAGLVGQARAACADMAVTTDVIVGFPGESEEEFSQSLEFVRGMDFAGGHVFNYSSRPGTAAARMPGQVPLEIRKERSSQMRAVIKEAEERYYRRFLGRQAAVLWEATDQLGPEGWRLQGLSDNFLRISAISREKLWNQVSVVRLEKLVGDVIAGNIL